MTRSRAVVNLKKGMKSRDQPKIKKQLTFVDQIVLGELSPTCLLRGNIFNDKKQTGSENKRKFTQPIRYSTDHQDARIIP